MPYFVQRPQVYFGMQWAGDNFAALETWCAENTPWCLPMVDVGDGTVNLNPDSWPPTLDQGDWVTTGGVIRDADLYQYQEVVGTPPFSYDVTGT